MGAKTGTADNSNIRQLIKEELNALFSQAQNHGNDDDSSDELMTEAEAADILKAKKQTLSVWRSAGKGPNFIKLNGAVRYSKKALMEWIDSCVIKIN